MRYEVLYTGSDLSTVREEHDELLRAVGRALVITNGWVIDGFRHVRPETGLYQKGDDWRKIYVGEVE